MDGVDVEAVADAEVVVVDGDVDDGEGCVVVGGCDCDAGPADNYPDA